MLSKGGSWGKESLSVSDFNTSPTDAWDLRSQWVFPPSQPNDCGFKHIFYLFSLNGLLWPYWEYHKRLYGDTSSALVISLFCFLLLFQKYNDFSKATVTVNQNSSWALPWTPSTSMLVPEAFNVKSFWETQEKWWNNEPVFLLKARQLNRGQINLTITFLPLV